MVRLNDHLDMTIAIVWDLKQQPDKQTKTGKLVKTSESNTRLLKSLKARVRNDNIHDLSFFPTIHNNCCLLSHLLCTLVAYIANNMDPDQTAPLGAV